MNTRQVNVCSRNLTTNFKIKVRQDIPMWSNSVPRMNQYSGSRWKGSFGNLTLAGVMRNTFWLYFEVLKMLNEHKIQQNLFLLKCPLKNSRVERCGIAHKTTPKPWSPIWVLVYVLIAPFPIWLFLMSEEKATENGSGVWAPATHVGDHKLLAPGFNLSTPSHCSYLSNEKIFPPLSPSLDNSDFQINKFDKWSKWAS